MIYGDVGIGRHMYDLIMLLKQTIWITFLFLYKNISYRVCRIKYANLLNKLICKRLNVPENKMHLKLFFLIRRMRNALEIANEACAISREDARHEGIVC